jgi:hypothetical protein
VENTHHGRLAGNTVSGSSSPLLMRLVAMVFVNRNRSLGEEERIAGPSTLRRNMIVSHRPKAVIGVGEWRP